MKVRVGSLTCHDEAKGGALVQPDQPDGSGDNNPVDYGDVLHSVQHPAPPLEILLRGRSHAEEDAQLRDMQRFQKDTITGRCFGHVGVSWTLPENCWTLQQADSPGASTDGGHTPRYDRRPSYQSPSRMLAVSFQGLFHRDRF
jgi:hypothetical protein